MNRILCFCFCLSWLLVMVSALPAALPDHGYGAPHSSSGYGAPSSGYGAPAYKPPSYSAPKNEVVHVHHHYHHAPKPTYEKPTYHAPKPTYHAPAPSYHAPSYHAPSYTRGGHHGHGHGDHHDDDFIHLHKGELTRSALLFGAGILKGAIITGLINNANNGVTIGK